MTYNPKVVLAYLDACEIRPLPELEFRFDKKRRWRWDFCWPGQLVALEIQGGLWTRGRHVRGKGYLNDMEKWNAGTLAGWRILLVTPQQLLTWQTVEMLRKLLHHDY